MLHLQFTLQSHELITLFRRKQFHTTKWRWLPLIFFILLIAWICFQIGGWGGFQMFFFFFAMMLIWLLWGYPNVVLRAMKKMPSWGKPIAYVFDENGLTQQTDVSKTTVEWKAIMRADEWTDWFLLHLSSPMIFYAIPKRALNIEQQQTLKTLLKNKGLLNISK